MFWNVHSRPHGLVGLCVVLMNLLTDKLLALGVGVEENPLKSCLSVSRVETGTPGGGGCVLVREGGQGVDSVTTFPGGVAFWVMVTVRNHESSK